MEKSYNGSVHQFALITVPFAVEVNSVWRGPHEIVHGTKTRIWIKASLAHIVETGIHPMVGVISAFGEFTDEEGDTFVLAVPIVWCQFLTVYEAELIWESLTGGAEIAA